MTIASTNRKAGPYVGNGVATAFPFSFKVFSDADLYAVRADSNGAETVLVLTAEYTASINADQDTNPGGAITLPAPLATGYTLTITSALEYVQPTDLTNNGGFYPKVIGNALDRLTIFCQQLYEQLNRSLKLAISVPPGVKVTLPVPVPYQILGWDGTGTELVNADPTAASALAPDLASGDPAKGAALVGYIQSGAGAVASSVQARLRTRALATDFAVGDNSTNDTAAFASLEAAHKGKAVDLLGRTYLVNSLPDGAVYFNGVFRVGANAYTMPRNPLSHPLDGAPVAIMEDPDAHYWPGPAGQPANDDILIGCHVHGWRHGVSLGAPLLAEVSYDGGITWQDTRTVYANAAREPRGLVGGMVTSSRYGVFFVEVDSGGYVQGTIFAYTDNNGADWTSVSVGTTAMYPHGEFAMDDLGGLNVFGYGGGNIYRARSADNGATWTVTTAKAGGAPIAAPVEPTVVKVGAGKFLMFVRNDAGGNMYASTSADCATWSPWVDSGVPLGSNPPLALSAWGRVWLYLAARRSTPINDLEDKLLVAAVDGDAVYAAGGVVGAVPLDVAFAGKTVMIGYLTVSRLRNGRFLGFMIDGETLTGSTNPATARVVRLGGHTGPVAAPALTRARRMQPPITHNPCFNHWTRGVSFLGLSSTAAVADRWLVFGSGANIDITRVDVADAARKVLPANSRYGMRLVSAAGGSGRGVVQRFPQRERAQQMCDRAVTMTAVIAGTLPGYFFGQAVLNFGSGGSASRSVSANTAQRTMAGGLTLFTATFYTPSADGATWGVDPYMQLGFHQNDAGAADATFYGLWFDWGDQSIPLDPLDIDAERAVLDQYCNRQTFGAFDLVGIGIGAGTANVPVLARFPKMIATPAVSSPDAATNLRVGGTALSSVGYSLISPQVVQLDAVMSSGSLASGAAGYLSVVSGGAWSMIADVGV